jgi:low affinity Fe/Cu permease
VRDRFHRLACHVSEVAGSPHAFLAALAVVLVWAISGPLFGFSDSWQLVINTGTTVVTFLMVFLIQATQNRETRAIHLKLDELVRAQGRARNIFADLEDATEEELTELEAEFRKVRARAEARSKRVDARH